MTQFRARSPQALPEVTKNIIIINVIVALAQYFIGDKYFNFSDVLALHSWNSDLFKPWQLLTHMFMHSTLDMGHIFSNMLGLYFFGSVLENVWGPKKFFIFYIVCGLGAALFHLSALFYENQVMINAANHAIDLTSIKNFMSQYGQDLVYNVEPTPMQVAEFRLNTATVGASGAVFGCLAGFAYLFPNTEIQIYFVIPIKAKWFVLLYAGFELVMTIRNSAGDNIAHVAHLGGALVGFVLVYYWNKTNKKTFY